MFFFILKFKSFHSQLPKGTGERNFHIFYYILAGVPSTTLSKIGLQSDPSHYAYLNGGTTPRAKSKVHELILEPMLIFAYFRSYLILYFFFLTEQRARAVPNPKRSRRDVQQADDSHD